MEECVQLRKKRDEEEGNASFRVARRRSVLLPRRGLINRDLIGRPAWTLADEEGPLNSALFAIKGHRSLSAPLAERLVYRVDGVDGPQEMERN